MKSSSNMVKGNNNFSVSVYWWLKQADIDEIVGRICSLPGVLGTHMLSTYLLSVELSAESDKETIIDEVIKLDGISTYSRSRPQQNVF